MNFYVACRESFDADEVLSYLEAEVESVREYSFELGWLGWRDFMRCSAKLEQEFFRAWARFYPPGSDYEALDADSPELKRVSIFRSLATKPRSINSAMPPSGF